MRKNAGSTRVYFFSTLLMFFLGLIPVGLNLVVDPYELNEFVQIDLEKQKISEKAHYPLWKINHYQEEQTNIIVLGDSRARALRNKYWHELGLKGAYNFAYGGATIYEIFDTFQFIKKNPNLKKLVIGIQLRSFDEDHKAGLNRVPEAIRLNNNPFEYYSNWFVSRIALKNIEKKYRLQVSKLTSPIPNLISDAGAENITIRTNNLSQLLDPEICKNCQLPQNLPSLPHSSSYNGPDYYFANRMGRWSSLWQPISITRSLPLKFNNQVKKNARSDWQAFNFSNKLWAHLVEISEWCNRNDIDLVFVIPPTIVEMQQRIIDFGYGDLNHEFRINLASLAPVIDFDFNNKVTRDTGRFTDAYHFNYKLSKLIVGEISQYLAMTSSSVKLSKKRRKDVVCPILPGDEKKVIEDTIYKVSEGKSCRIWRMKND
ncbi:MAG: hypothetical protein V7776_19760 [Halopseudomonas aestusnigri]